MDRYQLIDFIVEHSPRSKDIAAKSGIDAAKDDLTNKPLDVLQDIYEDLMHENHVGHSWRKQEQAPTLPDHYEEILKGFN